MDSVQTKIQQAEDELRALAFELADLMKNYSQKEEFVSEALINIPVMEKKLKKKAEMLAQEKNDNDIIVSRIKTLESILCGKTDSSSDDYSKFYKKLYKEKGTEEFKNTDFDSAPTSENKPDPVLAQNDLKLRKNSD